MRKKIKVAILSYYSGIVSRGVETFVTELSCRAGEEFELEIFSKLPEDKNIKFFSKRVLGELAQRPPQILMPLNNGWMSFLAKLFCWRYPTKLVLAGFAGIGRIDAMNLWLFPHSFICCTQAQAFWAKKINPLAKLTVIPLGVNVDRFQPVGKKYFLNLLPPIILCVAGPEAYKRVNLAIKAASCLEKVSLLVVGRQPEAINRLGVELLGQRYQNIVVDYAKLDQVYRAADLFTLPSEANEAYGITILEALASGLPAIINNDPIRHELGGKAAIYVDPTDLTIFSQAMQQNLNQKNKPIFRKQALKFSWDNITHQYENLWRNLS